MPFPSTECSFVTVNQDATFRAVTVAQALTVTAVVQTNQPVTSDTLTTSTLQLGTTLPAVLTVLPGGGDTLSVTATNIVCGGATLAVRDAFAPQQGITAAPAFPTLDLSFTRGVLTSATPPTYVAIMSINTALLSSGSSDSFSFALPLTATGDYNFVVTWGDGTASTITAFDQPERVHTYAIEGVYSLTFNGTLTGWQFAYTGDRLKLLYVSAWGNIVLGGALDGGFFQGCNNLDIAPGAGSPLGPATTTLDSCFNECTSLRSINIAEWDVSAVENMSSMFAGASSFNVNLSAWNTSRVQYMGGLFTDCVLFNNGDTGNSGNSPLTWNTSSVLNMDGMFSGAFAFNQTLVLSDLSGVTSTNSMFAFAPLFNNGDLTNAGDKPLFGGTAMPALTDASAMFLQCYAFNQSVTAVFELSSQLAFTLQMFNEASIFNNGDLTDAGRAPFSLSTTKLISTNFMFARAAAFNQTLNLADLSLLRTAESMFDGADAFNNGDITDAGAKPITWTTSLDFSTASAMFRDAVQFNQTVSLTNWATSLDSMFLRAGLFNNGDTSDVAQFPLTVSATGRSFQYLISMFEGCASFNQTVTFENLSAALDLASLFRGAERFNNGDVTNAHARPMDFGPTAAVTSVYQMFAGCHAFNQELTFTNLTSLQTTSGMFTDAQIFNNGDPGNTGSAPLTWATSSALTDLSYMFSGTSAFNQLVNLSDTSGVTTTSNMFATSALYNNGDPGNTGAAPLTWTTPALSDASRMFFNAAAFNQRIDFTSYASLTGASAMFSSAAAFNNGVVGNVGGVPLAFPGATLTGADNILSSASSFNQEFQVDTSAVADLNSLFASASLYNNGNVTNGGASALTLHTASATTVSNLFYGCSAFNQHIVFNGGTALVTTWSSMFQFCTIFNHGDVTNVGAAALVLDTSAANTFDFMLNVCVAFNQELVFSDTSRVQNVFGMLAGCALFNNGDPANSSAAPLVFNTSSLSFASNMFTRCAVLNQALVFSDMSHVTNMGNMMHRCARLKQDLSSWVVTACTNFFSFFNEDLNSPDSATSQANYDALLIAWAAQPLQSGLTLDMGPTMKYSAAAVAARATLTGTFGWTVNDGGLAP